MKIAILAESMLPGSIPKIISEETKYLRQLGHKVNVLTIVKRGVPSETCQFQGNLLEGIQIRELSREFPSAKFFDFGLPFFSFLSGYHLAGLFFVPRVIKEKEYDIIIAFNALTCLTAYRVWKRCQIPYVAYMWDPFSYLLHKVYFYRLRKAVFTRYPLINCPKVGILPLLKVASQLERLIVENSLVTITLSQPHADLLRTLTVKKDVEIVYMGCNFVENIPEKRGEYLLAIDKWDRGNMPHILLEILERLNRKANLVVAGFCSEKWIQESFLKLIEDKGLTEQVKWVGPVNEEELEDLYLGARAWVHPIEETSISMPALEAAGHGCPIVIPKWTPLFEHGVNAFFPKDIDEFAEYVNRLLDDERLAWRMGYEAWKVAKEFSWENHTKRLEGIIKRYVIKHQ